MVLMSTNKFRNGAAVAGDGDFVSAMEKLRCMFMSYYPILMSEIKY